MWWRRGPQGLWNPGLLRFGFQAMFMLVLGHVLALAPPVLRGLNRAVRWVTLTPRFAPAKVALLEHGAGVVELGPWPCGRRHFGARRVGRDAEASGFGWIAVAVPRHARRGGIHRPPGVARWPQRSAPLKVAEAGHLASLVPQASWAPTLPETISLTETVFAPWSLMVTGAVVALWWRCSHGWAAG